VRKGYVDVLNWLILLFPVVPANVPLMTEQCDRKLILKFVNDRKFRSIQVFVGIHERVPDITNDESSGRHQSIPSVTTKRGKENNEQRHQTGIEREQVVIGILAFVADMLRCLDEQLVLLQQVVLVLFAVLLGRPALQLRTCCQLAIPLDERLQIVPSPFVHFVGSFGCRGFGAGLICITVQKEVRQVFLLSDFKLGGNASGGMGVLTADDDHLPTLPNAFTRFPLPVASEWFLHRPIANLKRRVFVFGLTN